MYVTNKLPDLDNISLSLLKNTLDAIQILFTITLSLVLQILQKGDYIYGSFLKPEATNGYIKIKFTKNPKKGTIPFLSQHPTSDRLCECHPHTLEKSKSTGSTGAHFSFPTRHRQKSRIPKQND